MNIKTFLYDGSIKLIQKYMNLKYTKLFKYISKELYKKNPYLLCEKETVRRFQNLEDGNFISVYRHERKYMYLDNYFYILSEVVYDVDKKTLWHKVNKTLSLGRILQLVKENKMKEIEVHNLKFEGTDCGGNDLIII